MKKILIDAIHKDDHRVVLLDANNQVEELRHSNIKDQIQGNIYIAKVVRIEPSLQAAFINYGGNRNGFLPFSEIHPSYYNAYKNKTKLDDILNVATIPDDFNSQKEEILDTKDEIEAVMNSDSLSHDDISINNNTKTSKVTDEYDTKENIENDILLSKDNDQDTKTDDEVTNTDTLSTVVEPLPKVYKQHSIQDVIHKGQLLLVQVQKEERGNKGASFTTHITLVGKYSIFMTNSPYSSGISKRIIQTHERKRLKTLIVSILKETKLYDFSSLIVRTAGFNKSDYDVKLDYLYLIRLWSTIVNNALLVTKPTLIHLEEDLIAKSIRDLCDHRVDEIIVQGFDALEQTHDFIKKIIPSDIHKLKEYKGDISLLSFYNVEEQLAQLYTPFAPLPSGGSIVINPTEALIAIDINSGKSTSEHNIQDTALKTNLEAVKVIVRQLKLRNLSGLIVIDFIDMNSPQHKQIVEKSLKNLMITQDSARVQIGPISNLGLLEMSRQRLQPSFLERNTVTCTHCDGKGVVRSPIANSKLLLRTIQDEINNSSLKIKSLVVSGHQDSIMSLMNNNKSDILEIENQYNIKIDLSIDNNCTFESFSIEKIKSKVPKKGNTIEPVISIYSKSTKSPQSATEKYGDLKKQNINNDRNNINTNQINDNINIQSKKELSSSNASNSSNSAVNKAGSSHNTRFKTHKNFNSKHKYSHVQKESSVDIKIDGSKQKLENKQERNNNENNAYYNLKHATSTTDNIVHVTNVDSSDNTNFKKNTDISNANNSIMNISNTASKNSSVSEGNRNGSTNRMEKTSRINYRKYKKKMKGSESINIDVKLIQDTNHNTQTNIDKASV